MSNRRDTHAPPVYRILLQLGRSLGLRWAGDNEKAVVYRLERYHSTRGPGFFWINPLTQTVRCFLGIAPDFITITASDIQTKDALQLDLNVALAYAFNPDLMPPEKAPVFVTWTRNVHRAIVCDNARRALQAVVPWFFAEQICRGEVFDAIEQRLKCELTERMRPVALKPVICMILQVQVPAKLQNRFEAVVQRRVNIDDISQYEPYELTQAMRVEALEALQYLSGGKQYINMPDFTDMVLPPPGEGRSQPRRIARPAMRPDGTPAQQEPPSDSLAGSGKRPKSRL